jgi:hypothetical protein
MIEKISLQKTTVVGSWQLADGSWQMVGAAESENN